MTNRELRRALLALAVPVALESIFQSALGFVDQVVVGHLGVSPLAAAGLTNNVMFLMSMIVGAIAAGASILVAQHHGRKDNEGIERVTGAAVVSAIVVAVPPTIVTALFPGEVLSLLGAEPDVVEQGRQFFRIVALTLPISLLGAVAVGVLRSLGDVRSPMLITMGSVAANTVLNLILVFGLGPIPAFGVAGAAAATLISQILRLAALGHVLLVRQQTVPLRLKRFTGFGKPILRSLLRVSYPIMLNDMLWGLGNFTHMLICVHVGTVAVAATQMVGAALGIVNTVPSGLAVAGLTMIGNELGAGEVEEMRRSAREVLKLAVATAALLGAGARGGEPGGARALSQREPGGHPGAGLGLIVNGVLYAGMVMNIVVGNGILRAGGDTRFVLIASLLSVYAVGVPLTLILVLWFKLGLWGIFLGRGAEEVSRRSCSFRGSGRSAGTRARCRRKARELQSSCKEYIQ
ncbi:MAG: MATE family efflux transporter [Polyangiaceae bacterium]